jgi:hypothetical protein
MSSLLLTVMDRMGVTLPEFGNSSVQLPEL